MHLLQSHYLHLPHKIHHMEYSSEHIVPHSSQVPVLQHSDVLLPHPLLTDYVLPPILPWLLTILSAWMPNFQLYNHFHSMHQHRQSLFQAYWYPKQDLL